MKYLSYCCRTSSDVKRIWGGRIFRVWSVFFLIFSICALPLSVKAQTDENTAPLEDEESDDFEDGEILISAGPNYTRFSGSGYPVRFGYKMFGEGGVYLQLPFPEEFPAIVGVEYQRKGYDIHQVKTGTLANGKAFTDEANGKVRIDYLTLNGFLRVGYPRVDQRLNLLLGSGVSLRARYYEEFTAKRTIPADSLVIPVTNQKRGNDALDFLDVNVSAGLRYRFAKRFEIWGLATRKLFGFSIGKQNFITSSEINTNFSLRLVYRLPPLFTRY